ncbi:MAG: hypothetical protein ACJAWL_001198 [Motiliproteus sp.]|jgi:hypothetical protein
MLCAAPQLLDREQVAQQVKRDYAGKILDLKPVTTGEGPAFRVKLLLPSGRVKLLLIDAVDGRLRPSANPATTIPATTSPAAKEQ